MGELAICVGIRRFNRCLVVTVIWFELLKGHQAVPILIKDPEADMVFFSCAHPMDATTIRQKMIISIFPKHLISHLPNRIYQPALRKAVYNGVMSPCQTKIKAPKGWLASLFPIGARWLIGAVCAFKWSCFPCGCIRFAYHKKYSRRSITLSMFSSVSNRIMRPWAS